METLLLGNHTIEITTATREITTTPITIATPASIIQQSKRK